MQTVTVQMAFEPIIVLVELVAQDVKVNVPLFRHFSPVKCGFLASVIVAELKSMSSWTWTLE